MTITPDAETRLRREIQESLLSTIEDVLETPVRPLTPVALKIAKHREGLICTILRFEAKIDD